jgi:hypothetical protein
MSKKIDHEIGEQMDGDAVPFFAHLLSAQDTSIESGPTYHCLDSPCTKKYPSDGDEPTSPTWDR